MPLTDIQIRNAKPLEKPYKLADSGGLYLLVNPNGSKLWRLKYRIHGKEKMLSIGPYLETKASEARKQREEAKEMLKQGIDPSQQKRVDKLTSKANAENSFEAVAREWHQTRADSWAASTAVNNLRILEINAFPWIGCRPIRDVSAPELLAVLRRVEERGLGDTAHRLRTVAGQVFRYGVATGRCEHDIASDLRGALKHHRKQHFAAVTEPTEFGKLLRDIWAYQGAFPTCVAFRLSVLFGLRPGEVRQLEWSEVETGDDALIRIPMGKMKQRRMHVVPLSKQAIALLESLRPLTGHGKYCFPGKQNHDRPMSENTINAALRRLGYDTQGDHSAHGFRSSFSTLAHDSGHWRREVVEVQLSHKHAGEVALSYDRGDYLRERRQLMQWWSDECDRMRVGAEVIPIRAGTHE
jgi:integrase